MPNPKETELVPCVLCKDPVDKDDSLCYGCQHHICEQCDKNAPWGQHDVEAHWEES